LPGIGINFQPPGTAVSGYLADTGSIFGARANGYTYGWNMNVSPQTRNRNNPLSLDERYDTLTHMGNAVWEIALPNGTYTVHVVVGDPSYTDVVSRLTLEGVLALSGATSSSNRWLEATVSVSVNDGRLTVGNQVGSYNKISYIDITPTGPPTPPPSAPAGTRINFQPAGPAFSGYLVDSGLVFGDRGNGQSYGWNVNIAGESRNRNNALSPDERYDTLIHMGNRVWEIALPNGNYTVHVVVGDPSYTDVVSRLAVEDVLAINGATNGSNRWLEATVPVSVNDGKLTVGNLAGSYNKICYIEILVR
jgi:hypothetical protein